MKYVLFVAKQTADTFPAIWPKANFLQLWFQFSMLDKLFKLPFFLVFFFGFLDDFKFEAQISRLSKSTKFPWLFVAIEMFQKSNVITSQRQVFLKLEKCTHIDWTDQQKQWESFACAHFILYDRKNAHAQENYVEIRMMLHLKDTIILLASRLPFPRAYLRSIY